MHKLISIKSKFGHIDVFTNATRGIILAEPHGYIGPGLIKRDLEFLTRWDTECKGSWKYVVDISNVKIIHPINPFLLRQIRQFSKLNEYVVYSPSLIIRSMLALTSWIIKPDRIVKDKTALEDFLNIGI